MFSSPFYKKEIQVGQMKDNGVADHHREKCKIWDMVFLLERFAHGLDVKCERRN